MSMNPFRGRTQYFEFGRESSLQIERLIKAVSDAPPIGETSLSQKLDAIIDMQKQFEIRFTQLESRTETIHGLIFDLTQFKGKVEEFMSTQEERLRNIQTGLTSVADGVNTLQKQIADLKANNPALEDEISAIETTVKGIADDINGVTEPPVEG